MAAPTLRDVAAQAGVSMGTASQALNGRPNVSPETRAHVLEIAAALGYPIKESAARTAETTVAVVGLLTKHDYGTDEPALANPFYSHIQAGVDQACRKAGLSLMLSGLEVDASNRPVLWPAMIEEQRIDGLLIAGAFLDGALDHVRRRIQLPIVLIDSYAPSQTFDSVVIDNVEGARDATTHLVELGHRAIGLIGWNPGAPPSFHGRRDGYERTLLERGFAPLIGETPELTRGGAYDATRQLLARAPETTAVFVCNDEMAIGAMRAAQDLGMRVPHDLSVVGFDNIDLARDIQPALTTVHVHKSWMGTIGLKLLLDRAQNPDQPRVTVIVATRLVVRESAGPPRG